MNVEKYEMCPRCGCDWVDQRAYDMQACGCANGLPLAELPQPVKVDAEFRQFLSDVLTAAGLIEHGKQSKALADRLAIGVQNYRTVALQPEAAPRLTVDALRGEFERRYRGSVAATRLESGIYLSPTVEREWRAFVRQHMEPMTVDRVQLTDEAITEGCQSLGVGVYQTLAAAFKAGVRFAETKHGIGGAL